MKLVNENSKSPDWFLEAVQVDYDDHWVEVDGCSIHYQSWGDRDREIPGILFVHGNGAHSHWWDFIAPSFSGDFRVAALDLSGAGESGHRDEYNAQLFAREVMCVATDAGFNDNIILVGHSFGGSITRLAASTHEERVVGLVLVDSAIVPGRRNPSRLQAGIAQRSMSKKQKPARSYASLETASKRFRLRPPQPCDNRYILQYIAEHSVREGSTGWQWKLDQRIFDKMTSSRITKENPLEVIKQMKCPVSMIYGCNSRFFPSAVVSNLTEVFTAENMIAIEDAHHHLFLDQPLQFVSSLQDVFRRWDLFANTQTANTSSTPED